MNICRFGVFLKHQNDVQQAVKCFFEVAEWILMVLKKDLCKISNREIILLDEFKKDELTWEEFWKANLLQVAINDLHCNCLFIELSNRPKGTTKDQMEKKGCHFSESESYRDEHQKSVSILICDCCGQKWKEQEFEAMQYWSFHMYPQNT